VRGMTWRAISARPYDEPVAGEAPVQKGLLVHVPVHALRQQGAGEGRLQYVCV